MISPFVYLCLLCSLFILSFFRRIIQRIHRNIRKSPGQLLDLLVYFRHFLRIIPDLIAMVEFRPHFRDFRIDVLKLQMLFQFTCLEYAACLMVDLGCSHQLVVGVK